MQLDALRAFVKVAELASFTRAGEHLGISKARVSTLVQTLETELGSRLLQRTTRAVRLTSDGERLVVRARRLVIEADELSSMFMAPSTVRGVVRVDAPVAIARAQLIPNLPAFFALHPGIEVFLSSTDRRVDLVREGFDCVLRVGQLPDSGLTARKLGSMPTMNCVSPAYVAQHGMPRSLEDLARHFVVHYSIRFGADLPSFDYEAGGRSVVLPMRSMITVNSTDAYLAACIAGLGIIQAPRHSMMESVRTSAIVEVLPEYTCAPMPVSLVHGHARNVPKHVRVFMSWVAQQVTPNLD